MDNNMHVIIKPEKESKLVKETPKKKSVSNKLPANIGIEFKDPDQIKESYRSFKDFLSN